MKLVTEAQLMRLVKKSKQQMYFGMSNMMNCVFEFLDDKYALAVYRDSYTFQAAVLAVNPKLPYDFWGYIDCENVTELKDTVVRLNSAIEFDSIKTFVGIAA